MAKQEISRDNYGKARELLEKALVYPENLGEGKLEGSKDNNINYYLGVATEAMGTGRPPLNTTRQRPLALTRWLE